MDQEIKKEATQPEKKAVGEGKKPMSNLQMFAFGLVGILIVVVIVGVVLVVRATRHLSTNPVVLATAKVLNLSAAKINGLSVSYADYIEDLQTLNKFYKATPEVPTPTAKQVSDQVISRLVANALIGKLAKEYNVTAEQKDLDDFKTNILSQFGGDEAKARTELQTKYGWTLEKYMSRVIRPMILEQKLQTAFSSSEKEIDNKYQEEQAHALHILFAVNNPDEDVKVKAQAQKVLNEIKAGADFAEMAKQYGSDDTKDKGGDLGWFSHGQMVPEFEKAVFALGAGELSPVLVKTQFGYHIVKLLEIKQAKNYFIFMDDQFKSADIKILLGIHNPFEKLNATSTVDETAATTTEPAAQK